VLQRVPGHDEDPQRGRHTRLGTGEAGPAERQLGQHLVSDRSVPQHRRHLRRKASQGIGASVGHRIASSESCGKPYDGIAAVRVRPTARPRPSHRAPFRSTFDVGVPPRPNNATAVVSVLAHADIGASVLRCHRGGEHGTHLGAGQDYGHLPE
jgi:hypothetical protein